MISQLHYNNNEDDEEQTSLEILTERECVSVGRRQLSRLHLRPGLSVASSRPNAFRRASRRGAIRAEVESCLISELLIFPPLRNCIGRMYFSQFFFFSTTSFFFGKSPRQQQNVRKERVRPWVNEWVSDNNNSKRVRTKVATLLQFEPPPSLLPKPLLLLLDYSTRMSARTTLGGNVCESLDNGGGNSSWHAAERTITSAAGATGTKPLCTCDSWLDTV